MSTEHDPLFELAARAAIENRSATPALLMRRLTIGFARAAKLIEQLESSGVLARSDGFTPNAVLVDESGLRKILSHIG